jgi:hypothetical protein
MDGDLGGDIETVGASAIRPSARGPAVYLNGPAQFNTTRDICQRLVDRGAIDESEDAALEAGLAGDTVDLAASSPAIIVVAPERVAARARCSRT